MGMSNCTRVSLASMRRWQVACTLCRGSFVRDEHFSVSNFIRMVRCKRRVWVVVRESRRKEETIAVSRPVAEVRCALQKCHDQCIQVHLTDDTQTHVWESSWWWSLIAASTCTCTGDMRRPPSSFHLEETSASTHSVPAITGKPVQLVLQSRVVSG